MLFLKFKKKEKTSLVNKEIITVTCIFAALFIALICYIAYYTVAKSELFINNTYNNKRAGILAEKIVRGNIISRDGKVLAKTVSSDEGEKREYPYGNLFAHAVGFYSRDNGTIGVEATTNFKLLTSSDIFTSRLLNDIDGIKNQGDTVITTFDTKIQHFV